MERHGNFFISFFFINSLKLATVRPYVKKFAITLVYSTASVTL